MMKMRKHCGLKTVKMVVFTVFMLLLLAGEYRFVSAASATVDISTKSTKVEKGDVVYVNITVNATDEIGGFKAYFSYDNSVLRYVTGGNLMSGNDDEFSLTDIERTDGKKTIKYAVKFIARGEGSTTIALKSPYEIYDMENSEQMSVSSNELSIMVEKKEKVQQTEEPKATKKPEKKKDKPKDKENVISSYLEELEVEGVELSPDFSPEIFRYSGIVRTDKKSLDISYSTEDINSKVKVKGNKNLSEGRNTIKVIVTDSSGGQSTYRLSIKVERKVSDISESSKSEIAVSLKDGNVVLHDKKDYTIVDADKSDVPSGFGKTQMKFGGHVIDAYALESDKNHDFLLIFCETEKSGAEFYVYDKESDSILPYNKVQSWYRSVSGNSSTVLDESELEISNQRLKYIIAIMVIVCLILVIIIISVILKSKEKEYVVYDIPSKKADNSEKRSVSELPENDMEEEESEISDKPEQSYKSNVGEDDWRKRHAWQGRSFDDKF